MPDAPSNRLLALRRWLVVIAICLACGAVLQALVGWGCLLASHDGVPTVTTRTAAQIARPLDVPQVVNADGSTQGPPIAELNQHDGLGWYVSVENARAKTPAGRRCWGEFAWVRCGWPMQSFELHWERIADDGTWPDWKKDPGGGEGWCDIAGGATPAGMVVALFPNRPIWRGAAINTLVFGAAVLLAYRLVRGWTFLTRQSRGAERSKQGQCVRCAYPLSGGAICPECGHAANSGAPSKPR